MICVSLAFVVAVNCWSVNLASRTQVILTFIKMFALVLIIIPGVIALAKGMMMEAGILNKMEFLGTFELFNWSLQERQKISRMDLSWSP